jgi:type II secretory pathway pseudopilin PulG
MLVLVLLVCALLSAWLTVRYTASIRRMQMLQNQVLAVNNARGVLQSLLNEVGEYSKKNPAILPILQPAAPKPAQPAPAAKPAVK